MSPQGAIINIVDIVLLQGAASMVWRLAGGTNPLYKTVITVMKVAVL